MTASMTGIVVATTMPREAMHVVALVGAERIAFRVADVEEVMDAPALLAAPNAPEGLVGQFVHRDRTVRAFDAAFAFGIPDARPRGAMLVVRVADDRIGLLVDDVEELAALDAAAVRPTPPGVDPGGLLRGVCLPRAGGARGDETSGALICLVNAVALVARLTSLGRGERAGAS